MITFSKEPKIGITGARGRYAPLLAEYLRGKGARVVTFSRLAGEGHEDLQSLLHPPTLARMDVLLHFGWGTVPKVAEEKQGAERQKDLPFLSKLLKSFSQLAEKEKPYFLFPSTGAVYGECGEQPVTEEAPLNPKSYYAAGKVAAEELLQQHVVHGGGKVGIFRISNLYGALGRSRVPQGVIAKLWECSQKKGSPKIWGDGSATKDYLHVTDFCEAVVSFLERQLVGTWNLCTGTSHSLRDLLFIFSKELNWNTKCDFLPHPSWDVEKTNLSPQKLISATGWRPKTTLEHGVRELLSAPPNPF